MIEIPLIQELRAIRKRLAQDQHLDVERYAAMLREVAKSLPGVYVTKPFLPPAEPKMEGDTKSPG